MKKKVLIFYISKHSGHFHAAMAIEKGLRGILEDIQIDKINALSYTNPILGSIINKAYLEVIKKKPEIWGHLYDNPDVIKKTKKAREALHKFNMSKVRNLLDAYSPDVIYCTQAFPCGMVADYKRSCGKDTMLVGVLTDHAPHSYWLFDEVDFYAVPSGETAAVLKDKGVPEEKLRVYGIPVDPKFRLRHDRQKIRQDLGFATEAPVVLIMGGSQGLGAVEEVVGSLLEDEEHGYRLLVVTGANKKLFSRLNRLNRARGGNSMKVFSFVDNIDELMEASDIIITKGGGLTTAEAVVKNLPMLIVRPIPGHEKMNTDYLVEKGAAIEVKDRADLHRVLNRLFDQEDELDGMRDSTGKLAKPDSALDIARLALEA